MRQHCQGPCFRLLNRRLCMPLFSWAFVTSDAGQGAPLEHAANTYMGA